MSSIFVLVLILKTATANEEAKENDAELKPEKVVPFMAFINTDHIEMAPPNLFADPETCYRKKAEFGYKCHAIFIHYEINAPFDIKANISKGMTTNACLNMAAKHEQTVIAGFEIMKNDSEGLDSFYFWHCDFKDYFKATSNGQDVVGHFKRISNPNDENDDQIDQGYCQKLKQVVAEKYDAFNFKSKNLFQKRGLTDAQVLQAECRIYGWKVLNPIWDEPMEFEPFSHSIKLLSSKDCIKQINRQQWQSIPELLEQIKEPLVKKHDLCIENADLKLCPKYAEGAPVMCKMDNNDVLIGLANKRPYFGKAVKNKEPLIIVTKLYKDSSNIRNDSMLCQGNLALLYLMLLVVKYRIHAIT